MTSLFPLVQKMIGVGTPVPAQVHIIFIVVVLALHSACFVKAGGTVERQIGR